MKKLHKIALGALSLSALSLLTINGLAEDVNKAEVAQTPEQTEVQVANGRGWSPLGTRAWTDGTYWYNQPGGDIIC